MRYLRYCWSAGVIAAEMWSIQVKTRVQRDALTGVKDRESAWALFRRLQQKGISRLYRGLGVSALRSAISMSAPLSKVTSMESDFAVTAHGVMWLML